MKETIGKDCVSFDGKVFSITAVGYSTVYEIEAHRLRTYADCVKWLSQLCDKTWFTPKLARDFINTFSLATGLSVYGT